jgi:hypothetical protein
MSIMLKAARSALSIYGYIQTQNLGLVQIILNYLGFAR